MILNAPNVDVNKANFLGWTPLHEACFYNRIEIVKLLLLHGANATLRTKNSALPYHFASHLDVRELLSELGGKSAVHHSVFITTLQMLLCSVGA